MISPLKSGKRFRNLSCVTRTARRVSPTSFVRCALGLSASNGTYAPPALSTPRRPTIVSTERSRQRPTGLSGPTPFSRSRWARRFAFALSSAYVNCFSSHTTAKRSGLSAACFSTSCCAHLSSAYSAAVSLASNSRYCRSRSLRRDK